MRAVVTSWALPWKLASADVLALRWTLYTVASGPQTQARRINVRIWCNIAAVIATLAAPADAATIGMVAGGGDGLSGVAATLRSNDLWRRDDSRVAYALAAEWQLGYWKARDPGRSRLAIRFAASIPLCSAPPTDADSSAPHASPAKYSVSRIGRASAACALSPPTRT